MQDIQVLSFFILFLKIVNVSSTQICNLVWASKYHTDPNSHQTTLITRSKAFGQYHVGQSTDETLTTFVAKGFITHTKKFDILQNPNHCSTSWETLSPTSFKFAVATSPKNTSLVARTFFNDHWSTCELQRKSASSSCTLIDTATNLPMQITDLNRIQILNSFKKSPLRNVSLLQEEPALLAVRYPATDFIRNKADVTVTQTLSQTHVLEKSVRTSVDKFMDIDVHVLKDLFMFSLEKHRITRTIKTDRKDVETRRTITVPERTSIKTCTIMTITNSPIQARYEYDDNHFSGKGTIEAAANSVDSTYIVLPVDMRFFQNCIAVAEGYNTTEELTKGPGLSLEDIYNRFGL